jgi:hypothetical protein
MQTLSGVGDGEIKSIKGENSYALHAAPAQSLKSRLACFSAIHHSKGHWTFDTPQAATFLSTLCHAMPCQAMSMGVVHIASGTRNILVFWAA